MTEVQPLKEDRVRYNIDHHTAGEDEEEKNGRGGSLGDRFLSPATCVPPWYLRVTSIRRKEEGGTLEEERRRRDDGRERETHSGGCYAPSCTEVASVGSIGYAHINP